MDDDEDDDSVFDDDDYEEEKNEEEEEEEAKEETQRISDDMKRIESMMEQLKKAREQVMERLKDTFSKDEVLSEIMKFSAAEQRKVKPSSITEAINQEEEPLKPIAVEPKQQTAVHLVASRQTGTATSILRALLAAAGRDIRIRPDGHRHLFGARRGAEQACPIPGRRNGRRRRNFISDFGSQAGLKRSPPATLSDDSCDQ
ncbi:hypothetical protein LSTR_LSTR009769 [Laodelphax striatellus]|uniref:Uncharacterized protein n=1 Tax=Laodelphax striatellus TaxID=195883 RepID=A0A482WPB2_LAOST|nr:hypothetical protein LSTR_LSTR009769 [Laodelphax striatellus]